MYPFERFTGHAQKVLALAQEQAANFGHGHIGTEHLLLGMVEEEEGLAARALAALGVTVTALRPLVEEVVPPGPGEQRPARQIMPTARATRVLDLASETAGQQSIGTDHLLLGLVTEGDGAGALALRNLGADAASIRSAIERLRQERAE